MFDLEPTKPIYTFRVIIESLFLVLMCVDGPVIDALAPLATYNYHGGMFGVEGKSRGPFWDGTYIRIVRAT